MVYKKIYHMHMYEADVRLHTYVYVGVSLSE